MDNRDCYIMINPMKIINKEYLLQHKRVNCLISTNKKLLLFYKHNIAGAFFHNESRNTIFVLLLYNHGYQKLN